MKPFANFLFSCFFLVIGVAFTPASASKPSSSPHIKPKLYVTENAKHGKYGSLNDVLINETSFVFSIEDEDEDDKGQQNRSILKDASAWAFSSTHLSCDSRISHYG